MGRPLQSLLRFSGRVCNNRGVNAPAISAPLLGFFRRIVRGYFRRSFHGVRLSGLRHVVDTHTDDGRGSALMIYANHSSWWDPMVSILLAERLWPSRLHYAPMDADALRRYGILRRLGIFPVEMNSARGAAQFLRTGRAIVGGGGVLWVTPQGRFADARERPLAFKPGLAALAARVANDVGSCRVLPLAIEYTFWDERLPECLLRFGEAVTVLAGESSSAIDARLAEGLLTTMEQLREQAMTRDASCFTTLTHGSAGTGGFYGLGQRLKAFVLRREYHPDHTPLAAATPKDGTT